MIRTRPRQLITAAAITLFASLWAPAAAFGHASQVGSSPAADEVLDAAPSEVRIDFDSALLDMGAALVVRNDAKESITTGDAEVGDRTFTVPVDPTTAPGEYSVAFRVVSKDGHTIEGSFTYVVAGTSPSPTPETVEASTFPSDETTAQPPREPSGEATPSTAAPAATPDTMGAPPEGSSAPWLLFGGIGLVIGIGLVGAILLRR